jgi:cell division septation protein DedD
MDDDPYRVRAGGERNRTMMIAAIMVCIIAAFGAFAWNTYGGGPAPLITAEAEYKVAAAAPAVTVPETRDVYRVMEGASVTEIAAPGRPPAPAPLDLHRESGGGGAAPVAPTPMNAPVAVSAPVAPAAPVVASSGGYLAQLAALRSEDAARATWTEVSARDPGLLRGAKKSVQRADLGAQGVFFRLRAGYFPDREQANLFCDRLKASNMACMVVSQ